MAKVLVAPANFGLGHATRTVPIIKEFLEHGVEVHIGSSGAALNLLKQEFPKCIFANLIEYPHTLQSANAMTIPGLIHELSRILDVFKAENAAIEELNSEQRYNLIVSDGRYGAYSASSPSLIISHQLRFMPKHFGAMFGRLSEYFNKYYFGGFDTIIVPDNEDENISLSGDISRVSSLGLRAKTYYAGIICSISKSDVKKDIDLLVSISGPEPHRSELETLIFEQIITVNGRKVIVLGKPGEERTYNLDENTLVLSHAPRAQMTDLMNRSEAIVSRSGYTTLMELANIGLKRGLFIPTPGCMEQEYLSDRLNKKQWFLSKPTSQVDLNQDLKQNGFSGFPDMPNSEKNVKKLYELVFEPYL